MSQDNTNKDDTTQTKDIVLAQDALEQNLKIGFLEAGMNEMMSTINTVFGGDNKKGSSILITDAMDQAENVIGEKRKHLS